MFWFTYLNIYGGSKPTSPTKSHFSQKLVDVILFFGIIIYVNIFILGQCMSNRYLRVKKKQNTFSVMLVVIVLIMLAAVISYNKHELKQKQEAYTQKEEQLLKQIEEEKARAEEIAEYAKYTKTKKFAEEVAREKLGLVNNNEIIFKSED